MCLQVDYESEEEEAEEEDKEDQWEQEEENAEEEGVQESQAESSQGHGQKSSRGNRDLERDEDSSTQMRVNAVLQSNAAFHRYCFDLKHQLWCEVRSHGFRGGSSAHICCTPLLCCCHSRSTWCCPSPRCTLTSPRS